MTDPDNPFLLFFSHGRISASFMKVFRQQYRFVLILIAEGEAPYEAGGALMVLVKGHHNRTDLVNLPAHARRKKDVRRWVI